MRLAWSCMLTCCLVSGLSGAQDGPAPLRDEDVVQLLVSGTPVAELIQRVRNSEVDFDLSDEMQDELRRAGVPDELIRAMIERQAELHPPEPAPAPAAEAPAGPVLRVRLNSDWKPKEDQPRPVLRVLDAVGPEAVAALRLRPHERLFTDVAIVLLCRTATHVPDHWRNRTPLGRDFTSAPRHRVLAFLPGAEKVEAGKFRRSVSKLALLPGERDSAAELGVLELEVPEQIEVEVSTGEAHDLTLGLALQTGERYLLLAQDGWDGLIVGEQDRVVEAKLDSPKLDPSSLRARFVKPRKSDEPSTEAPGK
jgi:hypothetical protein